MYLFANISLYLLKILKILTLFYSYFVDFGLRHYNINTSDTDMIDPTPTYRFLFISLCGQIIAAANHFSLIITVTFGTEWETFWTATLYANLYTTKMSVH
jgi:hypothetical protein